MPEPQGRATLDTMSTTSTAPAPAAVRDPSSRATDAPSGVDAARAFGVMLGGPVVLLAGLSTAAIHTARAVRIDAPAEEVWPWIAQIVQDRGGFYSYTWLENLAGCRMRNADRVHPEWQRRDVGETVLLHPASGLRVLRFESGHALVLEGGWSLVVLDDGPESCRLVARFRAPAGLAGTGYARLLELPHLVVERKMLLEIKRRAERAA